MKINLLLCPNDCYFRTFLMLMFEKPIIHSQFKHNTLNIHLWRDNHTSFTTIIRAINHEYLLSSIITTSSEKAAVLYDRLFLKEKTKDYVSKVFKQS